MTCWSRGMCAGHVERQGYLYQRARQRNLFMSDLALKGPCSITPCQCRWEWDRKKSRGRKTEGDRHLKHQRCLTNKKLSEKEFVGPKNHTPLPRFRLVDIEIYWMFCSNDGKLDQGKEKWVQNEWREDWVLSLAWSQIRTHSRSLLWRWRCPWCWKDVVTQRIMFYLEGRKEVRINLRGKLRFQQAISFVLANLAGTSGQSCKGAYKWPVTSQNKWPPFITGFTFRKASLLKSILLKLAAVSYFLCCVCF